MYHVVDDGECAGDEVRGELARGCASQGEPRQPFSSAPLVGEEDVPLRSRVLSPLSSVPYGVH